MTITIISDQAWLIAGITLIILCLLGFQLYQHLFNRNPDSLTHGESRLNRLLATSGIGGLALVVASVSYALFTLCVYLCALIAVNIAPIITPFVKTGLSILVFGFTRFNPEPELESR